MAKLSRQYAEVLMKIAREQDNIEEIYEEALEILKTKKFEVTEDTPEELKIFFKFIDEKYILPTLYIFIEMVREELKIVHGEVISAIPLTEKQMSDLENKLSGEINKRIEIVNHVDTSLLGGLRIIIDNKVIDNSIKSKLSRMKEQLYKGVYF
ncbi:ATP synthase F1 subunit delta [Anaerosphaera multitolerans]|uniref:ATP synthase subunit delta n=1 Tax=Anaerosphaera multitolerans TaxID=2487351 RepID=A0A437S5X1_9FIRM|nr:ATP synthase F1 subunit delta [Anaerosphaera multitolerans]RVU54367.1 ATP synthase F1 subunit delta [Anaerosphaera multitolerans]